MHIYRIENITSELGKRDVNYKSVLKIDYVDGMEKKELEIKPGEIKYLTVVSMPLSMHRMRIKKWIRVDEIGKKELKKAMSDEKKKKQPKSTTTTTTTAKKRTYTRKSSSTAKKSTSTVKKTKE